MESLDNIKTVNLLVENEIDIFTKNCNNNKDKTIGLFCSSPYVEVLLIDLLHLQGKECEIYGIEGKFLKAMPIR
ncbi:MAG: hypothetical protein IKY21_03995 [Clostridia bacterium]|nr:hypothetical protein [Clostridia bacterium]